MQITKTEIPDLLVIEPQLFGDERGFFMKAITRKFGEKK